MKPVLVVSLVALFASCAVAGQDIPRPKPAVLPILDLDESSARQIGISIEAETYSDPTVSSLVSVQLTEDYFQFQTSCEATVSLFLISSETGRMAMAISDIDQVIDWDAEQQLQIASYDEWRVSVSLKVPKACQGVAKGNHILTL